MIETLRIQVQYVAPMINSLHFPSIYEGYSSSKEIFKYLSSLFKVPKEGLDPSSFSIDMIVLFASPVPSAISSMVSPAACLISFKFDIYLSTSNPLLR